MNDVNQSYVSLSSFDSSDVGSIKPRFRRKFLLRQPDLQPVSAYRFPKLLQDIVTGLAVHYTPASEKVGT